METPWGPSPALANSGVAGIRGRNWCAPVRDSLVGAPCLVKLLRWSPPFSGAGCCSSDLVAARLISCSCRVCGHAKISFDILRMYIYISRGYIYCCWRKKVAPIGRPRLPCPLGVVKHSRPRSGRQSTSPTCANISISPTRASQWTLYLFHSRIFGRSALPDHRQICDIKVASLRARSPSRNHFDSHIGPSPTSDTQPQGPSFCALR